MMIREIKLEEDLPEIARWFENHKWPMPVIDNIGPGFGFIAEEQGVGHACIHLYFTGRAVAFIDWFATNPDLPRVDTSSAIDLIIEKIKQMGQASNPPIKALCFFTKNKSLANRMLNHQFKKEEGYFRLLWTSK